MQRMLLALGLAALAFAAHHAWQSWRQAPAPGPAIDVPGRWHERRPARSDPTLSDEQRDEIARLEALGYASGSTAGSGASGVTVHDARRAQAGLNFYTSGHGPEALLVDMEGRVLHRWRYPFLDAWPDFPREWLEGENFAYWRRARLLPNGDVIAIFEGAGILRVDRHSQLVWASPVTAHHDLELLPDGSLYVLTRKAHVLSRVDPEAPVMEDYVTRLGPDGTELASFSLLEAFERSAYAALAEPARPLVERDLLHTNSLRVLDGRDGFAPGQLLVSALVPSVVAVVDPRRRSVVWALQGDFRRQHDPKLLPGGTLLVYDNLGAGEHSRVLEMRPEALGEPVWSYVGSTQRPFFSETCGTADRLANGNTLIVESDGGRAFEVTPEGETVWEFHNPHRAGPDGAYVATLFDLARHPPGYASAWLGAQSSRPR